MERMTRQPDPALFSEELKDLEFGPEHRFAEWPNALVPRFGAGVYTIWRDSVLIYAGISGRSISANTVKPDRVHGLFTRLKSHSEGRRSGDQFCVYVADRLVMTGLSQAQIREISEGRISFDRLIHDYIHAHLTYRFVMLKTGSQARALESLIRAGSLAAGRPMLNPVPSPAPRN